MLNFIDVEASGLGSGSYPIEVGVALADGSTHCTLVRPADDWTHWDKTAEELHGISRESLLVSGRAPIDVAMMLNEILAGQTVYSDAWGNDACWLARLFDEAGIAQRFKVDSVVSAVETELLDLWSYAKEQAERKLFLRRHRASNDALILYHTYSMLKNDELVTPILARCRADGDVRNVVDIARVRPDNNSVEARHAALEATLDHQIDAANQEQLLDLLDKKQLQY